ncbi:MAG TPA: hypothetical protein VJY39_19925 [Acidisphaera sp.]|nr:hypothetical protein [Acidisphaera sp.]
MDQITERTPTRGWLARGVRVACAIGMAVALSGCVVYPYHPYPYRPYYHPYYYGP